MNTNIRGEITYRNGDAEVREFDSMDAWAAFVEDSRDHPEIVSVELLPPREPEPTDAGQVLAYYANRARVRAARVAWHDAIRVAAFRTQQ